MLTLTAYNIQDINKLARSIASNLEPNNVITLQGNLGAGKTTLSQGIIKFLNPQIQDVPSPTFNIVLTYDSDLGEIWHFDLYRLKSENELEEIAFFDAIRSKVCIIEWPELAEKYLQTNSIRISINILPNSETREIKISANKDYLNKVLKNYEY
ncbi:MAG: tRNA (adenosine(37)-N6)-threonylcarbamoyltransferase complex ATPase subunit type 1 TsaE [Alphaproteobacteria bacterium]|nr:tRNA (adenosine(37)-N6)-threonylcarbamoyltransferase complex ATPase subunit type 1 TsaE [Alphaproteobacteria bacterium]OJV15708.1 MAG: tRNA (adenosine(37)-N6)-threonylcarbamoyltransferase complex ATPase subunit type 1 TsaE [Alphaproteobacteria bacterium 33-17]